MTNVTAERCDERHRPNRFLWGGALALLAIAAGTQLTALAFALGARTEVRQVQAESNKYEAVSEVKLENIEKTLKRIESGIRAIHNGHAGGPAIATESEG